MKFFSSKKNLSIPELPCFSLYSPPVLGVCGQELTVLNNVGLDIEVIVADPPNGRLYDLKVLCQIPHRPARVFINGGLDPGDKFIVPYGIGPLDVLLTLGGEAVLVLESVPGLLKVLGVLEEVRKKGIDITKYEY